MSSVDQPLCNRVAADGSLHAVRARGTMMGNRGGRLHDPATRRLGPARWRSRRWICCRLDFAGRRREVMGAGYTELFFLDEVTALAAGHRPCFECRRDDARAFAAAWGAARGLERPPSADQMDRALHGERLSGRDKSTHLASADSLPDGAVFQHGGQILTWRTGRLLVWSFDGYRPLAPHSSAVDIGTVAVLTPPSIVAVLAASYRPGWHPSAD
ncbi:hypothetical protein H1W37_10545 [Stappia taiwanensis]|uniref:Uncharacterized protein n=1 Tax=Stappia taiwanensis TaxID=992267 RepID=A0A838XYJ3_9HYPH|nr:hypothetical protein [Stappia taiwanensis]MBA4612094.1 hypothetical protein [Stappia taiwanensis]GGE91145.1 hypothetical protein GCM10007285_18420 [Stappia taiwanensis]